MPNGDDRSVSIGGNADRNVVVTGDRNAVHTSSTRVTLPSAENIDIRAELIGLRQALAVLGATDARKIETAIDDAEDESARGVPDRDEIGRILENALNYAAKADGFAAAAERLAPHVLRIAGWLGTAGHRLLGIVGLSL